MSLDIPKKLTRRSPKQDVSGPIFGHAGGGSSAF